MAFAQDEPFGGYVDDWRAGIGPATTINMNRVAKDGEPLPPPVNPFDCFPWRKEAVTPPPEEPPQESPEELARKIKAMLNRKAKAARKHGD